MITDAERLQIKDARKKFVAMAGAYFFGVFNDNFFKQAVLLMAVAAGQTAMQGYALFVFTLPFVLFAAPAGWLSDRFSKRHIIIGAKWLEFAAMMLGATGIITGWWPLIFGMLAVMGLQATIFSPALNGSLPELYPPSYVIQANATLRMIVTVAILSGIALSGIVLDCTGTVMGFDKGRFCIGVGVLVVAMIGLALSYGTPYRKAAHPTQPFPWYGPINTFKTLFDIARDKPLLTALFADMFIWFAGSVQILLINPLGVQQFQLSKTMTSMLTVSQLIGIGIGGIISARFVSPERWHRILAPAGFGMGVMMLLLALVPKCPATLHLPALFITIALTGICGGMFLIPVESFLQIRPDPARKGEIWATANFAVFSGILVSGPLSNALNLSFNPTTSFGILGVFALAAGVALALVFSKKEWKS